jgi:acetolactate synthase-1/2/3 large subunit
MKNTLDGGEAILDACRKLNVDYIVSSPGTEWAPVWEAMANQMQNGKDGPAFMDCWHETLAVDIAAGYTLVTGRMQAVLLHAGSGLLQGMMGVHGAYLAGVPMVVISGETMTYGENPDFDPGAQWVNNLSVVGGTTRLIEPIVKYACQAGSPYTIYESVIRAGELSQRTPTAPTYLSVSTETLMEEWVPPAQERTVPAAPKLLCAPEDIDKLAALLAKANNPVVITESAGAQVETYNALVGLCDVLALPVIETPSALFANFPKEHPMHQGHDFMQFKNDSDLVIVLRTRVPWYPTSTRPEKAKIVVIDETPHRDSMVYQNLHADMYLEGNVAATLEALTEALRSTGLDDAAIEARRVKLTESHDKLQEKRRAEHAEARKKPVIDPIWVCAALGEVMPEGTAYVDEVTTHTPLLRQHINWKGPQSLFSRQGGLGQGLGLSLGVKLAKPDDYVVTVIGDGAFLYNPVLQALGAARDYNLPTLTVILNNEKYSAMQGMHLKMYPDGTAVETDTFHGTHINAPDFVKVAEAFGAYGEKVEDPEKLIQALRNGMKAVDEGRSAIINVIVSR